LINQLPKGPEWSCEGIRIEGDMTNAEGEQLTEDVEVWMQNPVEVIQELFGNPAFTNDFAMATEKVFCDANQEHPLEDEAWTGSWWWDLQVSCHVRMKIEMLTRVHRRKSARRCRER
jgi:hypothetical protein